MYQVRESSNSRDEFPVQSLVRRDQIVFIGRKYELEEWVEVRGRLCNVIYK